MKFTTKCNNGMKIIVFSLLQLYNIAIGTLLTVFVPQKCDEHSCSIVEIINANNTVHDIALVWNSFTFLVFIVTYGVEMMRERWCVKHLENNPSNPVGEIYIFLQDYPDLEFKIKSLNFYYICWVKLAYFTYMVNILISGLSVGQNYLDATTITTFLGFVLLIMYKLNASFRVGCHSYDESVAYSAYNKYYMRYNALKEIHHDDYDFYTRI